MLKIRVIPTLLWDQFGLVKGKCFQSWRKVGIPLPAVTVYNQREVDELIFLDIKANQNQSEPDFLSVKDFSSVCHVPLTVGGGVRTLQHIRQLLMAGADKVAINTVAFEQPEFVQKAAQYFGAQCLVASIDVKLDANGQYSCFSHSGTQDQKVDPVAFAQTLEKLGVGEILVTAIDKDGVMKGYDTRLIQLITDAVSIPVIASGGAGKPEHMLEAIQANASAVAAASMFHFTQQTPKDVKQYLKSQGLPIRIQ